MPTNGPVDDRIDAAIERWQSQLLQLNRRNNLLYFKGNPEQALTGPRRRATLHCVPITNHGPDEIDEYLQGARKGRTFDFAERRRRPRGFEVEPASGDSDRPDNDVEVVSGDLKTEIEPLALQRVLQRFFKRDREWQEEQGLNVLFLAVGFLEWIDQEGEQAKSPLLLLPCDLKRSSPRDPFVLSREDDDASDNATLRHKLREFDVTLPEFEHESYSEYLDVVSRLVAGRAGWSVTNEVVLAIFQYTKLAMWEDLEEMRGTGMTHPLVRRLAGEELAEESNGAVTGSEFPPDSELAGGGLDDIIDLRTTFAVLPADHSQLRAIAAARSGQNLVIHGPPGTGKSQTIVNIISNLLAHGKRVLFVSEKSVALDVVKDRLERENLGVFCLDMHSERAKKSSVYGQLRKSRDDERRLHHFGFKQKALEDSRAALNDVVRSLHKTRRPLGRSIYQIHGEYAQVRDLPVIEFPVRDAANLEATELEEIISLSESIARQSEQFRDLRSPIWAPLKAEASSISIADQIRLDAKNALEIVQRIKQELKAQADCLGVRAPANIETAARLYNLARHLCQKPVVLPRWLERRAIPAFRRVVRNQREQQAEARKLAERVEQAFGGDAPDVDYQQLSSAARPSPEDIDALQAALGLDWPSRLVPDPTAILEMVERTHATATGLVEALKELAGQLEFEVPADSWREALRALSLARDLLNLDAPPEAWMDDADYLAEVKRLAGVARQTQEALDSAEKEFFADFDPPLIEAIDGDMLVRYRTDYQGWPRRLLGGAYRRDQRLLRGHSKTPRKLTLDEGLNAVGRAVEIHALRRNWDLAYAAAAPRLGHHANERATDWQKIDQQVDGVARLLREWPGSQARLWTLLASQDERQSLLSASDRLGAAVQALETALRDLHSDRLSLEQMGPAGIASSAGQSQAPLEKLAGHTQAVVRQLAEPPDDWWDFCRLIDEAARLRSIEQRERDERDDLLQDFGEFFRDRETLWDDVMKALMWCESLLNLVDGRPSERLREVVCAPDLPFDPGASAEQIESLQSSYPHDLELLDERFDARASVWGAWAAAPFDDLAEWLRSIERDADTAVSWIEFKQAADRLDGILGSGTIQRIRDASGDSNSVPGVVKRRLFAAWLDAVCGQDPRLRDFRAGDHEAMRRDFRRLDNVYPKVVQEKVREKLFAQYPGSRTSATGSGQIGVLNRQLTKKRRQMSVRRLLAEAPRAIQALKPCFLMSPLAVSQYFERTEVASANISFDAVIFDEASQVLPEDAVPAIARAKQTIVVGDQKQLPPTSFFQHRSEQEDDAPDDIDDVDWFEGRESILDVLVGMAGSGAAEHYLAVHYRSRHESLIRYSNHYFYEDRLLTFPSPKNAAHVGVTDVYLADGRYDAGGSGTNRLEAEKVVELIFELMRTGLEESVGVVTLSRKQADLIETLVDEKRLALSEFDHHFAPERDERFFVKNLENVQGDERDHIVMSVGYGPSTESGQVYNRFGPINNEGGERRLNVAVSRARKSMTVVHSLKAEDITSESTGARLLKRYLEFARSPDTAIEQNLTVNAQAETESPFEESVRKALVERGHQVDVQVGVSGYRIDLAIKAGDGQGYTLGIECDGATYHSAPAARDRDWLRQSVLEGLGWKIYRVWSRSWIQNPERELQAIERVLRETSPSPASVKEPLDSLEHRHDPAPDSSDRLIPQTADGVMDERPVDAEFRIETTAAPRPWEGEAGSGVIDQRETIRAHDGSAGDSFDFYEIADLSKFQVGLDIRFERNRTLHNLVKKVVWVEGPVHLDVVIERIRTRYGAGRVRGSTRDELHRVMRDACSAGLLKWLLEEDRGAAGSSVFLVTPEQTESVRPRAPHHDAPRDHPSGRGIKHIPMVELKTGILACAPSLYGSNRDDLIKATATGFGFKRTGKDIVNRIGEAVDQLVEDGRLVGNSDMLTVAD